MNIRKRAKDGVMMGRTTDASPDRPILGRWRNAVLTAQIRFKSLVPRSVYQILIQALDDAIAYAA